MKFGAGSLLGDKCAGSRAAQNYGQTGLTVPLIKTRHPREGDEQQLCGLVPFIRRERKRAGGEREGHGAVGAHGR